MEQELIFMDKWASMVLERLGTIPILLQQEFRQLVPEIQHGRLRNGRLPQGQVIVHRKHMYVITQAVVRVMIATLLHLIGQQQVFPTLLLQIQV